MYKITATVKKPGNAPTAWTRFSQIKLTKAQCEKMLSIAKEAGKTVQTDVKLSYFKCVKARA